MNIFKLKFKLHHLVNVLFYVIIFIIGFIFGLGIGNVKAYTSSDSIPSNKYFINTINFYLDETEEEYLLCSNGYCNSTRYSSYENRYFKLEEHHVYDYLHEVTEYLIQNISDNFDFVVLYFDYETGNSTWSGSNFNDNPNFFGSAIYVYYFPKNSLQNISFYYLSKFQGQGRDSSINYIPYSAFDVIPVSIVENYVDNNGYNRKRNVWNLDSLYSNDFSIINYYDFFPIVLNSPDRPSYLEKLNNMKNNIPSWVTSHNLSDSYISFINNAIDNLSFYYPSWNNYYAYPLSFCWNGSCNNFNGNVDGSFIYYSTLPVVFDISDYVYVLGSKVIYENDFIPTFSDEKSISFEILSDEQKTINYLNNNNYKMFCSDTQSIIISNGPDSPINIELFFLENIYDIDRDIYYDFYNYNLSDFSLNSIDSNNLPVYLSSNNLSYYNLPNYFDGYTYYNYSFNDNYLIISRTSYLEESNKINYLLYLMSLPGNSNLLSSYEQFDSSSYFFNHGVNFLSDDHSNYSNYDSSLDGNWCFYVTDGVYITSLTTKNSDDNYKDGDDVNDSCSKRDISFSGQVMTNNGLVDISYANPFCNIDENIWKYSDSFMIHNKTTFTFLTNISHYFFTNVDNRFFEGFLAIILIILFIKMCSYFGGGN